MNDINQQPDEEALQRQRRLRKRKLLLSSLFLVVAVVAAAGYSYQQIYGRFHETTDDAYVDGNRVEIGPQIDGTVVSILADDGDYVKQGQVLVKLDPADTQVALDKARAELASTVRRVRGLFSDVDSYRAQVATRKVDVSRARADYQRRQKLASSGAVSREEVAHSRDALSSAENALTSAQQQLNSTLALVEGTTLQTHPDVVAAAARLRQAYLDHARTQLIAPVSGYVAQRNVQVGERVKPGGALLSVIPLEQVWIDANFKETQIQKMRIGQPVDVTTDLYGDAVHYHGRVESLGVGTGSAFSLLPAQNASGNWIKIVQRLPVRIGLKPDELAAHPLRIGLSTQVNVDLHNQKGMMLAEKPRATARFSTDVYANQLRQANALISQLIQDNSSDIGHSNVASIAKSAP